MSLSGIPHSRYGMSLAPVKRLTDELYKTIDAVCLQSDLAKNARNHHQDGLCPAARLTWLFACLASLSKRGIIPANLEKQPAESAINAVSKSLFQHHDFFRDECEMALAVGQLIRRLQDQVKPGAFQKIQVNAIKCLEKHLNTEEKQASTVSDPLFTAWVYQYLIHQSEKELKRRKTDILHSPFYTKWFTPSWIAEFLVTESITDSGQTFVDPAAGAGHILVPALARTVNFLLANGNKKQQAVQTAIADLIFGFEIDAELAEASNFSLYLASRDIDERVSLPVANVFTVESVGGSLVLGSLNSAKASLTAAGNCKRMEPSLLPSKFQALAANPPYMSLRNMPKHQAEFLKQYYPLSKYDLYSAFLELSINMLEQNARASLICQQSVLSIARFKPLRKLLEQKCQFETIVQLGSGSFPTRSGEKVNNAIITLRRVKTLESSDCSAKKTSANLQYARILYPEEKRHAEAIGIRAVLESVESTAFLAQSESQKVLAPWCPSAVLELFEKHAPLQNNRAGIVVVNGLFTCNNKLFVKKFDDVPVDERHEYVPYDKGGGRKWFHSTPYLLHWQSDGDVIREYRASRGQSRSLPGEDYYFKPGITYSYIGTQGFKARLLSPESIFDIASSSVFTPDHLRMYMLGFMNSSLVRFLMGVLNPTINFQIGDLRRLPFAHPDALTQFEVSKLAQEAVELAKAIEGLQADTNNSEFLSYAKAREQLIQKEVDRLVFALYKIPARVQKQILQDPWVVRGQKDVFAGDGKGQRKKLVAAGKG